MIFVDGIRNWIHARRTSGFKVGDVIKVGEFFWIKESDFIGFDKGAKHGYGIERDRGTGSVDEMCSLEVRGFIRGEIVVCLMRPEIPYGAPAPIGTVFKISPYVLKSWGPKIRRAKSRDVEMDALSRQFCK